MEIELFSPTKISQKKGLRVEGISEQTAESTGASRCGPSSLVLEVLVPKEKKNGDGGKLIFYLDDS
jgi:hypothetical protein